MKSRSALAMYAVLTVAWLGMALLLWSSAATAGSPAKDARMAPPTKEPSSALRDVIEAQRGVTSKGTTTGFFDFRPTLVTTPTEPTLQEILDSLGYSINVATDETGLQTFPVTPGATYLARVLARYAGSSNNPFGWYIANLPESRAQIFSGGDGSGTIRSFSIPVDVTSISYYIYHGDSGNYWYTESNFNGDGEDHAWVFATQTAGQYIIAWEDFPDLGDRDFQDVVVLIAPEGSDIIPPIVDIGNQNPDVHEIQCSKTTIACCGTTVAFGTATDNVGVTRVVVNYGGTGWRDCNYDASIHVFVCPDYLGPGGLGLCAGCGGESLQDIVVWAYDAASNYGADQYRQIVTCKAYAVTLASYTATAHDGYVLIEWRTVSEINTEGFNLWCSQTEDGQYVKLNATLIPAQGSPTIGASYSYVDDTVANGATYYYKLEDVDTYGNSTFHGPMSARPARIFRIYLPLIFKQR